MISASVYEGFLKHNIKKLEKLNPVYTLSGGIDSSLIFSYLESPECFCVQVDGNSDYEFAKTLYKDVIKIEFNNIDIEKILMEVQSLPNGPHCGMSDFYDYFVYRQYPGRLIVLGEEPRYKYGVNVTRDIRKLFFLFRYSKVDSPYMYNEMIYNKANVMKLAKDRLPSNIVNRQKKEVGHNPIFKERHQDQITYLKHKYHIREQNYNKMWGKLNLKIWMQKKN